MLAENARYFAMMYTSDADGGWNDKATWSSWRPITAIRTADSDDNLATDADPSWDPFIVTPPFPEHPSGHACMTSAIVQSTSGPPTPRVR